MSSPPPGHNSFTIHDIIPLSRGGKDPRELRSLLPLL
jgi:hypothetical protein